MREIKVKFLNKDKSLFYPELKDQVEAYFKNKGITKTGGSRLMTKAIVMLGIYIIPYILILTNQFSGVGMLLLSVVVGIGVASVGMNIMHDANHGSFSDKAWINRLFGGSMYLLGGTVYNWKQQHNIAHHTFTNIHSHDEDITGKPFLRLCPSERKKSIHKYQHIYAFLLYGLMTFSFFIRDFKLILGAIGLNKSADSYPKVEMRKLVLSKVCYTIFILVLPLTLVDITFWQWLLGFFLMHFTAGMIMSIVFQVAHIVEGTEHPTPDLNGKIEESWAVHQLSTTANFSGNFLVSWFIGGLDYQIEHHLFPTISHVHYKDLSKIVNSTALQFNLAYNNKTSFMNAIGSHINVLKQLGK